MQRTARARRNRRGRGLPAALAVLATLGVLPPAAADKAPAGAEYLKGLELLKQRKLAEAAAAFEDALRHEPAETGALKYRDPEGRHLHPYYPNFHLGQVRFEQAMGEADPYARRDLLQEAIRRFRATLHPWSSVRLKSAQKILAKTQAEIHEIELRTPPPEIAQLRTEVDRLCDDRKFVEAFREIEQRKPLFEGFEQLYGKMTGSIRTRQRAALGNFEAILAARLDGLSRTDPTYEPDIVLPLLEPARVPDGVTDTPAPRFTWLEEFVALYAEHVTRFREASTSTAREVLVTAAAFEELAAKALSIDLLGGYRAARRMATSVRLARLNELVADAGKPGSELPGSDAFQQSCAALVAAAEESGRAAAEALAERPEEAARKFRVSTLPAQARQLEFIKGQITALTLAHERRVSAEATARAVETGLFNPEIMGDPQAIRQLAQPLSVLAAQPHFPTLPAPLRARALYARSVCEAMTVFLEAGSAARARERCESDVKRAFALDPKADARWKQAGTLSPRIEKLFGTILQ